VIGNGGTVGGGGGAEQAGLQLQGFVTQGFSGGAPQACGLQEQGLS
jgi:hypothetical protein